jgi:FlaA1/EpsC-like NDP-sugar epimerase/lipopolysaccharide/colanic/teichoic acid biosynthesis glycosyltransferase
MKLDSQKGQVLIKRIFDFFASVFGLILLSPVFLIVAIFIKLDSGGSVLFRQERIGQGFHKFRIYKFRTMFDDAKHSEKRSIFWQNHRVTRFGGFLRKSKIDELPQLINVLKGEMSLVGPRPELESFVQLFKDKYLKILTVRPGITDLASLQYRNEGEILNGSANPESQYINNILPNKIRLALLYIDQASFLFDLNLILRTILRIDFKKPPKTNKLQLNPQGIAFFCIDFLLSISSLFLAYLLRYEGVIPKNELENAIYLLPFLIACRFLAYFWYKFYSRFWQYSSLEDLILIIKGVGLGSLFFVAAIFTQSNPPLPLPRSVLIIDFILLSTMLGISRISWRIWNERNKQKTFNNKNGIPTLIYGAGDTGAHLLKNLRSKPSNYRICGFIDDNSKKKNTTLMGIRVLGNRNSISTLASDLKVKEILIAKINISPESLIEILKICSENSINCKIVSLVEDISTNELHLSKIKKFEVSDLLGRSAVSLDVPAINKLVYGKRVLVTGAGGSIGSELCNQILEYKPSKLIMLDRGENYLFELNATLDSRKPEVLDKAEKHYIFCSITNKRKMDSIFFQYRPQLVFHAAAHKHVPLMEENVDEAVMNNIYGTKLTADVSDKYGVERFVMVSTDKAIRPTSVMGTTKKIAEKYVKYMNTKSNTNFMTVRFGNVLGSKGSVVPFFQNQIKNGGPVTVTHPEMTRYFMLISEAAQLILQAGVIGKGGEILMLEMGEPVKITDLAKTMIRLAGYEVNKDIDIKFVGIRSGEKLYEELVDEHDEVVETNHTKIKVLQSKIPISENINYKVEELFKEANKKDLIKLKLMMKDIIKEDFDFPGISGQLIKPHSFSQNLPG